MCRTATWPLAIPHASLTDAPARPRPSPHKPRIACRLRAPFARTKSLPPRAAKKGRAGRSTSYQPQQVECLCLPAHAAQTTTGISSHTAQLLLDAQQLVVLGDPVTTAGAAGLDHAAVQRHGQIGDGAVLGLPAAVAHDAGVTRPVRHV